MKNRKDTLAIWMGNKSPSVQAFIMLIAVPIFALLVVFVTLAAFSGLIIANEMGSVVGMIAFAVFLIYLIICGIFKFS